MLYFIQNSGEPMTAQQRRDRFPDGKCALCLKNFGWIAGFDPEEKEYFVQCRNCETCYPEDD